MGLYKRNAIYWYEFVFAGRRIRESAKTKSSTVAKEAEKDRRRALENTFAGLPAEKREDRIRSVADVLRPYLKNYPLDHRHQSVLFARGRLAHVRRLLKNVLLPDLTEDRIRDYIRVRLQEGASGRTINMELGELSRAIGKPWSILWPKVRKREERKDIGKALSSREEQSLLRAVDISSPNRSQLIGPLVRIALLTGMRVSEILGLTWKQIDFYSRVLTVGKAKTASGTGRQIPMNTQLYDVLAAHMEWFKHRFGSVAPDHFLFPFGAPAPCDPTRRITDMKSAWNALRKRAGVACRFHDLRHTVATKLAEAGVPESTMLALLGHMSRAMLERYSHIRLAAKRTAMDTVSLAPMDVLETDSRDQPLGVVPTVPPTFETAA